MRRLARALRLAAFAGSMVIAGRASAQGDTATDEARRLDGEARAAFERHDYVAAATTFDDAFERVPRADEKYNAALSWDLAGDAPRAADAFAAALALPSLDPTRTRASERRLAELRLRLGLVIVGRPSDALVTLAHVKGRPVPTEVHVQPGAVHVRFDLRDGRAIDRDVTLRAGQVLEIAGDEAAPALAPIAPAKPSLDHSIERAPEPLAPRTHVDPWPWIAFGAAAILAGTAVGLGVATLHARDDYVANHPEDAGAHDHVTRLRDWTNVAWGAAGVTATAGVVLLVVDAASPRRVAHRGAPLVWRF